LPEKGLFRSKDLGGGFRVHLYRTQAFKTIHAHLVFHADLDDATAARALVPRVLGRGTQRYPDLRSFQTALDLLFGATLTGDARKIGERQLLVYRAEWVTDRFAGQPLLAEVGRIWGELLHEPASDADGGLRESFILQERKMQADEAEAVFDDKGRYARHRLIEEMCKGEAFARPAYGRVAEIRALSVDDVRRAHRQVIERAPADLFVVGDLSWTHAVRLARGLKLSPNRKTARIRKTRRRPVKKVRTIQEKRDIGQGKLEMGFRTSIGLSSTLYPSLVLTNVLFGGSPVGKLFKTVREQASLCYSISSGVERTKGLVLVQAGIDPKNYAQARRLILKQLDELRAGRVSDEEFGRAREILLSSMRSMRDSPAALTEFALERSVNGVADDFEGLMKELGAVTVGDIKKAARTVQLDTVYFLKG
jgi:predicted Zn-dependent peptidase